MPFLMHKSLIASDISIHFMKWKNFILDSVSFVQLTPVLTTWLNFKYIYPDN